MKTSFTEWMADSKKLFKLLFGAKLYTQLEKTKLHTIDWKGLEVTCGGIRATFPGVKARFADMEYWEDKKITLLDLYLQTVFQFGYQQCHDCEVEKLEEEMEFYRKIVDSIIEKQKI